MAQTIDRAPISTISQTGTWAGDHTGVDDPYDTPDDATTIAQGSHASSAEMRMGITPLPAVASIASVTMKVRRKTDTGGNAGQQDRYGIRIGSTVYYAAGFVSTPASFTDATKTWTTSPATGAPWVKSELDTAQLVIEMFDDSAPTDGVQWTLVGLRIQIVPADLGKGREIATAMLRLLRRPIEVITLKVLPEILDAELMDDVSLSHFAHPLTQVLGVDGPHGAKMPGLDGWRRVLTQLRSVDLDLNTMVATVELWRRRGALLLYYDSGRSQRSGADIQDGLARLGTGGALTFSRSTKKWLADPATGLINEYAINQIPLSNQGLEFDGFAGQYVTRSSFISGLTGWTTVSGSPVAASRNNLFDSSVTTQSARLQNVCGIQHVAAAISGADTAHRFSLDYEGDAVGASGGLVFSMQRPSDSQWWRASDNTWQATEQDNSIATAVTTGPVRYKSPKITGLPGEASVTIRVKTLASGDDFYTDHVQLEGPAGVVTSRMVTDGAILSREADVYYVSHDATHPAISFVQGMIAVHWIPNFDSGERGDAPLFWHAREASGDEWYLQWDDANLELRFWIGESSSFTLVASLALTFSAGDVIDVACRWLDSAGAFGLPGYSCSVFAGINGADMVKGSSAARSATAIPSITRLMWGRDDGGDEGSKIGTLYGLFSGQEPLSFEEINARRWG